MLFDNLLFPLCNNRPFFFTSYVSTIDGKIFVKKPGYWPIGSSNDFDFFTFLRAHADVIIEGKNTALAFGDKTINTIHSEKFLTHRKKIGKEIPVEYMVLSREPDETLATILTNKYGYKSTVVTAKDSLVSEKINKVASVQRLPITKEQNLIPSFISYLTEKKYKNVFLDVGPLLLTEFIKASALDELFITHAPKLFGSSSDTVSLGDSELFSPDSVPIFSLISSEKVDDEVCLRYKLRVE